MLLVGLTGGIASGKSVVAARLGEHGAVVVDADRIAREVVEPGTPEEEIEEPEPEEILVVRLPPGMARAFSKRAQAVVGAGRPSCPFCGGPVDPAGHLCPRANGFRRTASA